MENKDSLFNKLYDKFESRKDEIVYSHNDFHTNNILKASSNHERFYIVDFDFSCFNILGYDIAYLINSELTPQKTEKPEDILLFRPDLKPSDEDLKELLKAYLILLSGNEISETGIAFVSKLREGKYDSYLDTSKLDRLFSEFN